MDFLEIVGVPSLTLEKVKEYNGEALLTDLYLNRIEVMEIIKYFHNIGLNVVDNLLVFTVDVFFRDLEEIKIKIQEYGVGKFVTTVNNDYFQITEIL